MKSKLRRSTKLNRVVQIIVSTPGHGISRFQAAEIATHLLASNDWNLEIASYLAANPYRFGSTVTW
jgi:superfamily II DNA/RNA helicase